jgi:magnesium-transporting ATPase (P-type)
MFLASFEDTTLQILIVSAIISLSIGLYENPKHGWIEGTSILFAVLLVAVVTAVNDYKKEQQFRVLNKVKDDVDVNCIRNSNMTSINVVDLVVGDIVILNAGDRIPADGITLLLLVNFTKYRT